MTRQTHGTRAGEDGQRETLCGKPVPTEWSPEDPWCPECTALFQAQDRRNMRRYIVQDMRSDPIACALFAAAYIARAGTGTPQERASQAIDDMVEALDGLAPEMEAARG